MCRHTYLRNQFARLRTATAQLFADQRAVAAVEFAFIAPILFIMYFLTVEASLAIENNKKVGRIGSMVADLITQQNALTSSQVDAILKIGGALLQPYGRSKPTITATAITISPNPGSTATVAWSRKMKNDVFSIGEAKGATVAVPTALNIPGSFLIRVKSELGYRPIITWSAEQKTALSLEAAFDVINMGETYYLRPRISNTITCSTC